jgi:hypothetical protein
MNFFCKKDKYQLPNVYGLFRQNNYYYFDNLEKAINENHYGSFIINIQEKDITQIIVIDGSLNKINYTFEFNTEPTIDNINKIIINNNFDYIFMIWLNNDYQIQSKMLYEPIY